MMLSTLFTTTFLFAVFALRARADLFVATVPLTQCQPATFTWDGSDCTGPYDVVIVYASNPCGDIVQDFGIVNDKSITWDKVNVTAQSTLMVSVLDANGKEGWSGAMTVQSSDDSSCLPAQKNTPSPSPSQSPYSPNDLGPSPATSTSSSKSPTPTVVGAANNGVMNSGTSTIHFSGMAVAFTAFCALAALL